MRRLVLLCALLLAARVTFAQNTFDLTVRDAATKEPVVGARVSVKDTEISALTGADGAARLAGVPDGEQTLEVFSVGYETEELKLTFPLDGPGGRVVFIKVTHEFGEVTVTTTRTGREIDDVPTRVEAIDEEESATRCSARSTTRSSTTLTTTTSRSCRGRTRSSSARASSSTSRTTRA